MLAYHKIIHNEFICIQSYAAGIGGVDAEEFVSNLFLVLASCLTCLPVRQSLSLQNTSVSNIQTHIIGSGAVQEGALGTDTLALMVTLLKYAVGQSPTYRHIL